MYRLSPLGSHLRGENLGLVQRPAQGVEPAEPSPFDPFGKGKGVGGGTNLRCPDV